MELIKTALGVAVVPGTSAPMLLRHIIGVGRNYAEHAKEQGAAAPTRPMFFTKNPASACLSGDDIVIPPCCRDPATGGDQVDYEAELAVIVGPGPVRDVAEREALAAVLGYAAANDVSARWWQKEGSGGQFCRGKSFDTFCPIGPAVTPAALVPDPQALRVTCRVNGDLRQDDSTASMTYPVALLIAELSRGTTLLPGTVILTGTPAGVGMARKPPAYLRDGDVVEVEVSGLGVVRNTVRYEPPR